MLSTIYLLFFFLLLSGAISLILLVRRKQFAGWLIGISAAIPFSVLFMIQYRCKSSGDSYRCGLMSFEGGLTWHILVGLLLFTFLWALASWVTQHLYNRELSACFNDLGYSLSPLLGLWVAVIWETLPRGIIHPVGEGGQCPWLPVICHDVPLWEIGGLTYYAIPFVVWTIVSFIVDRQGFGSATSLQLTSTLERTLR